MPIEWRHSASYTSRHVFESSRWHLEARRPLGYSGRPSYSAILEFEQAQRMSLSAKADRQVSLASAESVLRWQIKTIVRSFRTRRSPQECMRLKFFRRLPGFYCSICRIGRRQWYRESLARVRERLSSDTISRRLIYSSPETRRHSSIAAH
jgi:hypothetical protein